MLTPASGGQSAADLLILSVLLRQCRERDAARSFLCRNAAWLAESCKIECRDLMGDLDNAVFILQGRSDASNIFVTGWPRTCFSRSEPNLLKGECKV